MMQKTTQRVFLMAVTAALGIGASDVLADSTHGKRYLGGSIGLYSLDGSGNDSADLTTVEGRIGGFINPNVALEARLGLGFIGDELGARDVDLDYNFGAFTRIGLPLENMFPYIAAGFTRASMSFDNPDKDISETDVSYGVGADLNLMNLTLNLEYLSVVDKNDIDLSGFSIGFSTTF